MKNLRVLFKYLSLHDFCGVEYKLIFDMNRIKKTLLGIWTIVLVGLSANAQKLEFDELVHDFGVIKEEAGSVTHAFKFTNTGDKPLVIKKVQASCGCTTPGWTKEPVKPGESGEVLATYRTATGTFDKSLTVTADGLAPVVLHIKGNVTKKPEDFTVTYPQVFGELRSRNKRDFAFPQIFSKQVTPSQIIEVVNAGEHTVDITFEDVPEYIIANAVPASLNPRQKGQISVSINGEKRQSFGYSKDKITVKAGAAKETINVTSIVAEKIEQEEKFPVAELGQTDVDFGKVTGEKIVKTVEIKNIGNADLFIKSFTTDNSAFSVTLKKALKIKSGKTATLKFAAQNLEKGNNVGSIYLTTNDPSRSLLKISVKADVE
jgi:hypothetical protein